MRLHILTQYLAARDRTDIIGDRAGLIALRNALLEALSAGEARLADGEREITMRRVGE